MEQLRRLDASATKGATIVSLIIGIIGVISAYPIYTQMVRSKRAKLAPDFMRLTDELMK